MISEHSLLALVIRTLLILVAGAGCAVILYHDLYSKPFRNRLDRERWPHYESVSCFIVLVLGMLIFYHMGMHGGLFRCEFPECESAATVWLGLYPIALLLQPVAARFKDAPYTGREYLRWIAFGIAYWLVCYAAGKLDWMHVHYWYLREGGVLQ